MSDNHQEEIVRDRGNFEGFSKQGRFSDQEAETFFFSTYYWGKSVIDDDVEYAPDSRERDAWLLKVAQEEPNLQGVLNAVTTIDKNRGWRFTGGRNQVRRFTRIFHNFEVAPGLFGWRPAISHQSLSFWNTDMGAVTELGRDGRKGPVRALYCVDPTLCKLTGNNKYPLRYGKPRSKKLSDWNTNDFIRVASMVSVQDKYNGLGYCAVSRVLEMVKLMVAIHEHDSEELGAKAPRGLLLLQGISQEQWTGAMEARQAEMEGKGYKYFKSVATLASRNANLDAKLIALSQLPKGFDLRKWVDVLMYTYALCFGYDPAEFWPIQFGALGRGQEGTLQHEKATGKGRLDFVLSYQEQLQEFLPETLEFAFEQRDDQGNLLRASVNQAWIKNVKDLLEMGNGDVITREQALLLLADYGIVPRSWAPSEMAAATDTLGTGLTEGDTPDTDVSASPPTPDDMKARYNTGKMKLLKEKLLESPHIRRCAETFPSEPIVQYNFPANTEITLWERADEIFRPGSYAVG